MVDIIGSIKKAWHLALHPSTAKSMEISEAVTFYYSIAIIPGILAAIIAGILTGVSSAIAILLGVFIFDVILFFIEAAVIQLFGKVIFGKFTKDYSATFSAVIMGAIPPALFIWLSILTGGVLGIVFWIWSIILLTIALMKLQKVSGLVAVLSWAIPAIILTIIVLMAFMALLPYLGPLRGLGSLSNSTFNVTTTI